jgi:hypothetical protein
MRFINQNPAFKDDSLAGALPRVGEEVASPPSDGEAALLRAVVTPPESNYSKSSVLSSAIGARKAS